jgi:hypothetical protein
MQNGASHMAVIPNTNHPGVAFIKLLNFHVVILWFPIKSDLFYLSAIRKETGSISPFSYGRMREKRDKPIFTLISLFSQAEEFIYELS